MRTAAVFMTVGALLSAASPQAAAAEGCVPAEGAPANDCFADAEVLPAADTGAVTGTNILASKEPGEPNHVGNRGGASVWYTWTAPASVDDLGRSTERTTERYKHLLPTANERAISKLTKVFEQGGRSS